MQHTAQMVACDWSDVHVLIAQPTFSPESIKGDPEALEAAVEKVFVDLRNIEGYTTGFCSTLAGERIGHGML